MKTQTYLNEEDLNYLKEDLHFSWSNRGGSFSNDYYYIRENSRNIEVCLLKNKIIVDTLLPSFFGIVRRRRTFSSFDVFIKKYNKLSIFDILSLTLYRLNFIIFGIVFLLIKSILRLLSPKDYFKDLLFDIKKIITFNYNYMTDSLTFMLVLDGFIFGFIAHNLF